MKRRYFSLLLSLIFAAGLCTTIFAQDDRKTVRVGFFEMDGFFEKNADGSYSGYGYDYVVEMAKYENWHLEFVEGDFESLQYMMADDMTVDMLLGVYHYDDYEQYFEYSALPIGTGCTFVTARAGNDAIDYGSPRSLDGKRIGFISDRYKCEEFKAYAEENKISYTEVMFETNEALYAALGDGDVDAIAANDVFVSEGEKLVLSFGYNNLYIITKKGNVLINGINDANEDMIRNTPAFQWELYNKHYLSRGGSASKNVSDYLTADEKKFISECKTLKVGISTVLMTDKDGGCIYKSVIDMYDSIAELTGLSFEYFPVNETEEAVTLLNSGEIDIIGAFPENTALVESGNITLTSSFMTMNFRMVCERNSTLGDTPTLSLLRGAYYNKAIIEAFPKSSILYADTYHDAVHTLSSGNADAAVIESYIAEELLSDAEHSNVYSVSSDYSQKLACGISKDSDPLLISIMNKSAVCFSSDMLAEIIENNRSLSANNASVYTFVITHPIHSIALTAFLVLTIVVIVLLLYRLMRNKQNRRYRDMLTGFFNIDGFTVEGKKLLDANPRSTFVLSCININHFNYINSVYGLERGNDVLKFIAKTLDRELSGHYIIGRGDTDNFPILYECLTTESSDEFIAKIQSLLYSYGHAQREKYTVDIYAGSVFIDIDRPRYTVRELVEQALAAQVSIKNKPLKNAFFKEEMHEAASKMRRLAKQLSVAIDNEEFRVFFQPKHLVANSKEITGAELLTRWKKPDNSILYPEEFLNPLIDSNQIIKLDKYVLDKACSFIKSNMSDESFKNFVISVNISDSSAMQPGFAEYCQMKKKENGIPDGKITLEFSENIVFTNVTAFSTLFRRLRESGFGCAIDNFGLGNSSLRMLSEIGASEIKLDRMLFCAYDERTEQQNELIVSGILAVASAENISVTAMGVDRTSQLKTLQANGCDNVQGYIYAKPMDTDSFYEYCKNRGMSVAVR